LRYAVITRHRGEFAVRLMCRVLEVSPAGYYASRKRPASWHAVIDEVLMARVRVAHHASGATYGRPRIHRELQAEGFPVSPKRVARLMREGGLIVRRRKSYRGQTTDSTHQYPVAANLVAQEFTVPEMNRVWVADITHVPTREGTLYLAAILDLSSRRCIGWAMRNDLDGELTLSALRMAIAARRPAPGLIHHSDRGGQYAAATYQAVLTDHGMQSSMSRPANCYDNAVAESFFSTLECELFVKHSWRTRAEARQAIFRYIETWYNARRRHSTLGYVSPVDFEEQLKPAA
jgi:putative transposase